MIPVKPYLLLIALMFLPAAHAFDDDQFNAINELGQLNGLALNCGYIQETRRMKRTLVVILPKVRVLGEAFEQSTNKGFLAALSEKKPCPSETTLSLQVDQKIEQLEQRFQNQKSNLF